MPVFGRICMTYIGLTLETFCGGWVFNYKKYGTHHSIIWRWAVLCKKQDGGQIKICETFSGSSLKEYLSIDTTFDPCYFSWDSPFKGRQKASSRAAESTVRLLYKGSLTSTVPTDIPYGTIYLLQLKGSFSRQVRPMLLYIIWKLSL